MKTPRNLKCDVSTNFEFKFLEEKKQNNNMVESQYETKPQRAVAGTKHTITYYTNKIIHCKSISKLLPNSFQDPLSRRGENAREPYRRFTQQTTFLPVNTSAEEEEEDEGQTENAEHRQSTPTPHPSTETIEASF